MNKFNEKYQQLKYQFTNIGYNVVKFGLFTTINESEILLNFDIINESQKVFRFNKFKPLIDVIFDIGENQYEIFDKQYLENVGFKLKNWIKPDKELIVFKFDYNNLSQFFDFFEQHFNISKDSIKLNKIYNRLGPHSPGGYCPLSNQYGILLLNINVVSSDAIYHELIHFIQDVTGEGILAEKQPNGYFNPIEILAQLKLLNTFNLIDNNISYTLINKYEIIPYINNICHKLEQQNINKDVPLKLINQLIVKTKSLKQSPNNSINQLINYINDNLILGTLGLGEKAVLIICLIYDQHLTLIKKIIGNYFKDLNYYFSNNEFATHVDQLIVGLWNTYFMFYKNQYQNILFYLFMINDTIDNERDFKQSQLFYNYSLANNNDITPLVMYVASRYFNHKNQKIFNILKQTLTAKFNKIKGKIND